jgi:hypothetical protein
MNICTALYGLQMAFLLSSCLPYKAKRARICTYPFVEGCLKAYRRKEAFHVTHFSVRELGFDSSLGSGLPPPRLSILRH